MVIDSSSSISFTDLNNNTLLSFVPDNSIFKHCDISNGDKFIVIGKRSEMITTINCESMAITSDIPTITKCIDRNEFILESLSNVFPIVIKCDYNIQHNPCKYLQITYSSENRLYFTAESNGTINFWNIQADRQLISIPAEDRRISALGLDMSLKYIAIAYVDGRIHVWNILGQRILKAFSIELPVVNVAFAKSSKYLIIGGLDEKIRTLNIAKFIDS